MFDLFIYVLLYVDTLNFNYYLYNNISRTR